MQGGSERDGNRPAPIKDDSGKRRVPEKVARATSSPVKVPYELRARTPPDWQKLRRRRRTKRAKDPHEPDKVHGGRWIFSVTTPRRDTAPAERCGAGGLRHILVLSVSPWRAGGTGSAPGRAVALPGTETVEQRRISLRLFVIRPRLPGTIPEQSLDRLGEEGPRTFGGEWGGLGSSSDTSRPARLGPRYRPISALFARYASVVPRMCRIGAVRTRPARAPTSKSRWSPFTS